MKPATYQFYRLDDGTFVGRSLTLATDTDAQAFVALNTPPGCAALRHDGPIDVEASRVDLETRTVVEYQPPAPSDDHEWNASARRWALKPAAAERRDRRAAALSRIAELERKQLRAAREDALDEDRAGARARLRAIDDEIAALRADL